MKSHMILGALIGFLIGAGFSLAEGCAWATAFWRGCVAAMLVAWIARWWSRVWLNSLGDALRQRRQAAAHPLPKGKPITKA